MKSSLCVTHSGWNPEEKPQSDPGSSWGCEAWQGQRPGWMTSPLPLSSDPGVALSLGRASLLAPEF